VASIATQTREALRPSERRAAEEAGRRLRCEEVAAEARALLAAAGASDDAAPGRAAHAGRSDASVSRAAPEAARAVSGRRPR
jgi:hypothetical protein